jgi:hypothetical protein
MAQAQTGRTEKRQEHHGGVNPLVAAAAGATVGAVAATLADPAKRAQMGKMVGGVVDDLKAQGEKVKEVAAEKIEQAKEQARIAQEQTQQRIMETKKAAEDGADKQRGKMAKKM